MFVESCLLLSITSQETNIVQGSKMFLVRTVFWVSLVIFLLPIGGKEAGNMFGATKHAINGMDDFCNRNVDICNISEEAWKSFKYKAAYSIETLSKIAKEIKVQSTQSYSPVYRAKADNWGSLKEAAADKAKTGVDYTRNTLTSEDLEPDWSLSKNAKL